MKTITATELGRNLADYLNRAAYRGESFIVRRGGRAIAELRPCPQGILGAEFIQRYSSLPHLTPDEATDMARDLDDAREDLGQVPVESPWAS